MYGIEHTWYIIVQFGIGTYNTWYGTESYRIWTYWYCNHCNFWKWWHLRRWQWLGDISGSGLRDMIGHIESLLWFKKHNDPIFCFVSSEKSERKIMRCTRMWDELRSLINRIKRAQDNQSARDAIVYRKRARVTLMAKLSRFVCGSKHVIYGLRNHRL